MLFVYLIGHQLNDLRQSEFTVVSTYMAFVVLEHKEGQNC